MIHEKRDFHGDYVYRKKRETGCEVEVGVKVGCGAPAFPKVQHGMVQDNNKSFNGATSNPLCDADFDLIVYFSISSGKPSDRVDNSQ